VALARRLRRSAEGCGLGPTAEAFGGGLWPWAEGAMPLAGGGCALGARGSALRWGRRWPGGPSAPDRAAPRVCERAATTQARERPNRGVIATLAWGYRFTGFCITTQRDKPFVKGGGDGPSPVPRADGAAITSLRPSAWGLCDDALLRRFGHSKIGHHPTRPGRRSRARAEPCDPPAMRGFPEVGTIQVWALGRGAVALGRGGCEVG
jgi:hypothetical protein